MATKALHPKPGSKGLFRPDLTGRLLLLWNINPNLGFFFLGWTASTTTLASSLCFPNSVMIGSLKDFGMLFIRALLFFIYWVNFDKTARHLLKFTATDWNLISLFWPAHGSSYKLYKVQVGQWPSQGKSGWAAATLLTLAIHSRSRSITDSILSSHGLSLRDWAFLLNNIQHKVFSNQTYPETKHIWYL